MSKDDYKVGYRKPPKHTQFKKGQSGNPKGRRKGARGLKSDLRDELKERVTIHEDGKQVTLTKQRLMIKQLLNSAAKGHVQASDKVVKIVIALLGDEDEGNRTPAAISEEDEAIINDFFARQMEARSDE